MSLKLTLDSIPCSITLIAMTMATSPLGRPGMPLSPFKEALVVLATFLLFWVNYNITLQGYSEPMATTLHEYVRTCLRVHMAKAGLSSKRSVLWKMTRNAVSIITALVCWGFPIAIHCILINLPYDQPQDSPLYAAITWTFASWGAVTFVFSFALIRGVFDSQRSVYPPGSENKKRGYGRLATLRIVTCHMTLLPGAVVDDFLFPEKHWPFWVFAGAWWASATSTFLLLCFILLD